MATSSNPVSHEGPVRLGMKAKHPLAIRWFHWINFPLLGIMVWSGLWIYWANDVYRIGVGEYTLFKLFPQGFYSTLGIGGKLAKGMAWHFFFMWFFALNGAAYVLYTILSGEWRYLVPDRHSFKEALLITLHDLGIYKPVLPRRKFNGAQQVAYTGVVLMGAASLLTGLAIYKPIQLSWLVRLVGGYSAARFEHFWLAIGYVLFFLVHLAQVVRAGWNNFRSMVSGYEIVEAGYEGAREGSHE